MPPEDASRPEAFEYHVPIKSWHVSERPRERLLREGVHALSDAELIGLIFGSGTRTKRGSFSAVELGEALLRKYQTLYRLSVRDVKELMQAPGIGPAKAVQLVAAFELGRRASATAFGERIRIQSPEDVVTCYGPRMRDRDKEVFAILLLNTAGFDIGFYILSEGGLASSIVEPRAVFKRAILENAAGIICLHNHPSGNPEPSAEDIAVTRELVEAGKLMHIPVHDHIIIAGNSYTSLAERGLM